MDRPVWDEHDKMRPEWLTVQKVRKALAKHSPSEKDTFSRTYVIQLVNERRLRAYRTPYGRLFHAEDVARLIQERQLSDGIAS